MKPATDYNWEKSKNVYVGCRPSFVSVSCKHEGDKSCCLDSAVCCLSTRYPQTSCCSAHLFTLRLCCHACLLLLHRLYEGSGLEADVLDDHL